jgi:23S rRNA pseudouridine1911/1915/1917 synthase
VPKFTVEDLKTRLDKFIAEQMKTSRGKIQRDIEDGRVTVNGKVITLPHFAVRKDNEVAYDPSPEETIVPKNIPLHTLYNDHGLLILDKPAGLPVHPGAGFKGDSLAEALLYHFKDIHVVGEEGRSGIVHRLDKETSGVILIALTQEMYDHLKDAFADRKVKKEYLALVRGRIQKSHGLIDDQVGKSKLDFRKYTTSKSHMVLPKDALTEYWVLEQLTDGIDDYTLVRVKLHTGRTHQIRVHFSSLGFPLAGDSLYGPTKEPPKGLGRQFLHAKNIQVQLPDGTWIEAESELPRDLRETLEHLQSTKVKEL